MRKPVLMMLLVQFNIQPVPDSNFEAALSAYDNIAADGQVPTAAIETITSLNVSNKNISDVTGIEDFTALDTFFVNQQ